MTKAVATSPAAIIWLKSTFHGVGLQFGRGYARRWGRRKGEEARRQRYEQLRIRLESRISFHKNNDLDDGIGILDKSCLASLLTTPEQHQPRGNYVEIET